MEVADIGLDVPIQDIYPSYMERYFTPRYLVNVDSKEGEDMCVFIHSNRICLIALAPSHPVLKLRKNVSKVNFQASDKINRMDNKVSGKGKRGGQILQKMSLLCVIECEDGSVYSVRSCVPGKLVEINERLVETPNLVLEKPFSGGYIAIVLPPGLHSDKLKINLLTPELYQEAVIKRTAIDC